MSSAPSAPGRQSLIVPAWSGLRALRVRSRDSEDKAVSQVSFYLEPVDGLPLPTYQAGQFLTFELELPDANGTSETVTRCYSISDLPDQTAYRITIKRVLAPIDRPDLPPGKMSNYFHDRVGQGTIVYAHAPAGSFVLSDDAIVPSVLIAGGIGITPLFAMARAALASQPDRSIHLFYGVRDDRDVVFEIDLLAMEEHFANFQVTIIPSLPQSGQAEWNKYHATGFIDVALLRRILPQQTAYFYVCGPPAMLASLVPTLRQWTGDEDYVRYEAFGPASLQAGAPAVDPAATSLHAVKFAAAERTIEWTGADTNLLDFAERHGVAVGAGCRSGSCGSCETTLFSGNIGYTQKPSFDVGAGRCLLCVGYPTSDVVLGA